MPFLPACQQCQSTEGKSLISEEAYVKVMSKDVNVLLHTVLQVYCCCLLVAVTPLLTYYVSYNMN